MPYIGHNPTQAGSFILLDDFDSEFDGSDVTFTLQIGGVDITPTADNLLIILDGVVQHSPEAYTVSGSTLTFTAAPASGQEFYGMLMGQSASVGQGTVGADELSVSGDGSANQLLSSDADGTMTWKDGSLSTTSATGDLIYRNNSGVLERLAVGSAGQVLTVASGVPAWETDVESYLPLSGGTMTGALNMNSQNITNGGAIAGTFTGGLTGNVSGNLTGNVTGNTSGTAATVTGAAQSNITSVGTLTSLTTGTVTVDVNQTSAGLVIDNDTAGKGGIHFKDGGASKGMVGLTGVITGDSSEDMGMFSEHGSGIGLFVNGSGTRVAGIDSSGHATFTKHISTGGTYSFRAYGSGLYGETNTEHIEILHNGSGTGGGRIEVKKDGSGSYRDLTLWTGGSVGFTLDTSRNATFAGAVGVGGELTANELSIVSSSHAYANVVSSATTTASWVKWRQGSSNRWLGGVEGSQSHWQLYSLVNNGQRFGLDHDGNGTFAGTVGLNGLTNSSYDSGADDLVLGQTSGNGGLTIVSGTSNVGYINFADGTSGDEKYRGYIYFNHDSGDLGIVNRQSGTSERLIIKSDGALEAPSAIYSKGSEAIAKFDNRVGASTQWGWYATGDVAYLWQSVVGALISVENDGSATFAGGVTINSGSANKITHNHGSTALEIENQGSKRALYVHSNVDGGQDNPLVEIKADNPAFDQEVLRIHNDGANHSIQVLDDGSEVFSIASGGNVGIGHTTPQYGLTLAQGTSDSGKIGWEDAGNNKRGAIFVSSANDRMEFMTGTSDTVRMSIFSDGLVNINTTSQWNLQCQREDGSSQGMILFTNGSSNVGSITTTQAATYFNTSSDYRLKENEVAISDGITRLKQLKPYRFNFKVTPDTIVDGFFAHEVSSIVPEAIFGVKDAVDENGDIEAQGIDQSKLVPLLVSALQEAIDRIEALENA